MVSPAYLCAPSYAHGALRPIGALPELRADPSLGETLHAVGLETFAEADQPLLELATKSVETLLSACDLAPAAVDSLVFASTMYGFGKARYAPEEAGEWLGTLVRATGLQQAVPYGVSFGQCVNIVNAIELARGLLEAGQSHVLIVTADQMHPSFSRVVVPGVSITSDMTSAVLLSKRGLSPHHYRLGRVQKHVDWGLLEISPADNFPDYVRRTVGGMKALATKIYLSEALSPDDIEQLITNTINHSVCRIFSKATGVPAARIFSENVARLGHCDLADIVVNLADYGRAGAGQAGKPLLVIANGPYLWGGMALTRC